MLGFMHSKNRSAVRPGTRYAEGVATSRLRPPPFFCRTPSKREGRTLTVNTNDMQSNAQASQGGAPAAHVKVKSPLLALMGFLLGGFTGMYSETALNIALPQLTQAFGIGTGLAQWLIIGYMLVIGIVLPLSSLLTKWFPARKIALFALSAFFIGSLISGFGSTFAIVLAGRCIQGIGTGLVLPLMFAMVMEVVPPNRIGSAMGTVTLVIMFAPAVGPTLAGILCGVGSWRLIFFSFAVILAFAIFFLARFGVNPYQLTKPRIDGASILLSTLAFGGIVLGTGMASLYGWLSVMVLASLAVGIVCLVLYARRQLTLKAPVLNLHALSVPGFRLGCMMVMLNFGITLTVMYLLPQYYQNSLMVPVAMTGLLLLPGGVVNALVSLAAGRIYDRVGARIPALLGFTFSCAAGIMLLFADAQTPIAYVVASNIIIMVGVPMAMSPVQTHALSALPHRLSTDGSTIMNTLQQVVGAVSTALATSLLVSGRAAAADAGNQAAFANGSHWGFIFALAMALVGLVLATRLKAPERGRAAAPQAKTIEATEATVRDLMKTDVFTLHEGQTAYEALRLFSEKGISGAPVVNARGKLTGFVSDGDVMGLLADQVPTFTNPYSLVVIERNNTSFASRMQDVMNTNVEDIATKSVLSVNVDDSLAKACELLVSRHLKKAPVLEGGKMVGILNRSNITKYSVDNYSNEANR